MEKKNNLTIVAITIIVLFIIMIIINNKKTVPVENLSQSDIEINNAIKKDDINSINENLNSIETNDITVDDIKIIDTELNIKNITSDLLKTNI